MELLCGRRVRLSGLVQRTDLEGSAATLLEWTETAGRWAVELLSTGERIKVKRCNLVHVPEASAPRLLSACDDVESIAISLAKRHYAVIDGFTFRGSDELQSMMAKLRAQGALEGSAVAGGARAAEAARRLLDSRAAAAPLRGDLRMWLRPNATQAHPPLPEFLARLNLLVAELQASDTLAAEWGGSHALETFPAEVQLTCYPGGGSQYVRHVDNPLGREQRCGRWLTAILYPNEQWAEADGGVLRLHVGGAPTDVSCGFIDVEPRGSRLVLFWSDDRVPHAVLPTYKDRFAVSCWYHTRPEPVSTGSSCLGEQQVAAPLVSSEREGTHSNVDEQTGDATDRTMSAIEALVRQLHEEAEHL